MRLIDADRFRLLLHSAGYSGEGALVKLLDAAPTVDVPQPLTRDGVLAAVKAIEDAGGKAVVEAQDIYDGRWWGTNPNNWVSPDVPRWNVRVRAVEVETEDVPLTQLVGRTIKGETEAVAGRAVIAGKDVWWPTNEGFRHRPIPVDLATGRVTVVKGEA